MKVEKSIDLGKLQSDLLKAQALLNVATREVDRAHTAYQKAISVIERASEKRKRAQMAVDTAKRSMVEAARAIATL